MPDGFEQRLVVEPVDPIEGGQLDGLESAPGTGMSDDLGLVQADDGLGHRVVVAVTDAADGARDAGLGEALGVPDEHASDASAPPHWQDKPTLRQELRGQVRRLVQPLGFEGWYREIPLEVEAYAVTHCAKT